MTDSRSHRESRRSQSRQSDSTGSKTSNHPENPHHHRARRQSHAGNREASYQFDDRMEHQMCQLVTHRSPQGFPVVYRAELATMPPVEVARTDTRILLCDQLHDGPHIWPNGDEVS